MALTEKYASRLGAGAHDGTSPANAWTLAQAVAAVNALGAGGAAGLRLNYKYDGTTDAQTTNARTFSVGGTTTSPFIFRGYSSTIGDYHLGRSNGGTGPLIATNFPVISFTTGSLSFAASTIVEGISVSATNLNGSVLAIAATSVARAIIASNSRAGSGNAMSSSSGLVIDCDLSQTGSSGIALGAVNTNVVGCRITAATGTGINLGGTTNSVIVLGNLIYRCTTGISSGGTGHTDDIHGNTIVLCTTGFAGASSGLTTPQKFTNNLFADISGNAIDYGGSAQAAAMLSHNRFGRCGGLFNGATDWAAATNWAANTTSVLQAAEFVDATNNDFRLLSTSPAVGAGLFPSRDIGAFQQSAAGGGGYSRSGRGSIK